MILTSVLALSAWFRLPPRASRILTMAVGRVAGIINGFASIGGPRIVVYLLTLSIRAILLIAPAFRDW